jgi:hypothetical protein
LRLAASSTPLKKFFQVPWTLEQGVVCADVAEGVDLPRRLVQPDGTNRFSDGRVAFEQDTTGGNDKITVRMRSNTDTTSHISTAELQSPASIDYRSTSSGCFFENHKLIAMRRVPVPRHTISSPHCRLSDRTFNDRFAASR